MISRILLLLPLLGAVPAGAQHVDRPAITGARAGPDTLRLGALHREALAHDPRLRQIPLQRARSELRLHDLAVLWLPSVTAAGLGQYQSDVTTLPIRLPNGATPPIPARDTYDARLSLEQRLLDPAIGPRRAVEHAALAEVEAGVHTALYELRQEVNEAFFAAALLESRAGELAALIADLEAQQHVVEARVREGAALPGEAATIEAELLRRRQDEAQLRADRGAVLAVLGQLTGRAITEDDVLALPDLRDAVAASRADTAVPHARPEYEQLERTRERLARQAEATVAGERPRLSAFGRVGYGRPGLDLLSNRFQSYWLAGIRLEWPLWTWGTAAREREAIELEQRVVATQEAALTAAIRRAVARDLATIDRLQAALGTDDRIVMLRERIEREARAQFQEGVVTAADYVARRTDVLTARLARVTHRVELAQAGAHYLTTLGLEIP